jgi:hypothetical protein
VKDNVKQKKKTIFSQGFKRSMWDWNRIRAKFPQTKHCYTIINFKKKPVIERRSNHTVQQTARNEERKSIAKNTTKVFAISVID